MAIVELISPTPLLTEGSISANVTLPTIPDGTSRNVYIFGYWYNGGGTASVAPTLTANGQNATFVTGGLSGTPTDRVAIGAWVFFESQVAAISGQTLTSSSGTGSQKSLEVQAFSGASQTLPAVNWGFAASGTITLALTRAANSRTVARAFGRGTMAMLTMAEPSRQGVLFTNRYACYGSASDTESTVNFTTNTSLDTHALVFNINEAAGTKSINSTNSGANDLNADAVNTANVTGYDVGVNPVISGNVGSLALTSVSQATTIATFTIPAPINDSYYPQPDTSHTLTLTDGSNPATFDAVMNSLAGYTSIVLASPDLADTHKIPYWLTSTAVDDDRIMYKTADMTVAADGGISGATLGATTIYYHWRVADSKIYAYEALLNEDGIATSTGLTVSGLSVSGLGVSGLTVRGL